MIFRHALKILGKFLITLIIICPFLISGIYGFVFGDFPIWSTLMLLGFGGILGIIGFYLINSIETYCIVVSNNNSIFNNI